MRLKIHLSAAISAVALAALPSPVSSQCVAPGTALGRCLDAILSDTEETACEDCIDTAALESAPGECDAAAACAAIDACGTVCGSAATTCASQIIAKFECEQANERTTELNLEACPALDCSAEGPAPAPMDGEEVEPVPTPTDEQPAPAPTPTMDEEPAPSPTGDSGSSATSAGISGGRMMFGVAMVVLAIS